MGDRDLEGKKKRSGGEDATQKRPQQNVFDTHGNDAIRDRVTDLQAEQKKAGPEAAASSGGLLGLAATEVEGPDQEGPALDVRAGMSEVISELDSLRASPETLKALLEPGMKHREQISVLMDYLATEISPEAVEALASSTHDDLTTAIVVSTTSITACEGAGLKTQALGDFGPILFQLIEESLGPEALVGAAEEGAEEETNTATIELLEALRPVVGLLRTAGRPAWA